MSDKKHIDRLFQEKFKEFELAPNDAVWERIEAQLKEKNKRKVIPIWWRYAGVAAVVLLLLTTGNGYFNNNQTTNGDTPIQVVDTDDNNPLKLPNPENKDDSNPVDNHLKNKNGITNNNSLSKADSNKSGDTETTPKNENVLIPSHTSSIARETSKNDSKTEDNSTDEFIKNSDNNSNVFQTKNGINNRIELANTSEEKGNKSSETNDAELEQTKIDNFFNSNKNNKESNIADTKTDNSEKTNVSEKQHDLTIEKAIELAKNNSETHEKDSNRWSVAPNAAPVFFNSLGKGSSIDPQFNHNSKSSETNMSFGVSASYAVNKKISVRSGINKVNLGYNTNNVVAFQTMGIQSNMNALANVKPGLNEAGLSAINDISVLSSQNFANKSSENFATTSGINTSINQSLSFIEIPLEIKYLLSDKRLGIHVIGGFSSLFLNNNELHSHFDGSRVFIGEASNINKTSYSANFGFGLDYKVSKKFNLNLEPMFKYQINTFNNTSGNFKPYFIGVYTGVGFKF